MNSESQCMWNQNSHCLAKGTSGSCYTSDELKNGACDDFGTAGNKVIAVTASFSKFIEDLNSKLA